MEQEKGLNEVNWDEHWYGEHMTRLARSNFAPCADLEGVLKIVAEATRRGIEQGKREAWEEAKEVVINFTPFHITRDYKDTDSMRDNIIHVFNVELAALSNSSKE